MLAVTLALGLMLSAGSAGSFAAAPTTEVNIFSFNDFHGTLDNSASGSNPGAPRFTAIAQKIMGDVPNSAIMAAGDNYQGSAISNYFLGEPVSEMMKLLGVKYSAIGNHDYDWGPDKIVKYAKDGNLTFLAANVFFKGTDNRPDYCKPYATLEIAGKKIGVVGWANTSTPTLVTAEYVAGLDFRSNTGTWFVDMVKQWKAAEGWDAVIALTHGTLSGANLAGVIDGIITGHVHSTSTDPTDGVPTVRAGYNGRNLGRLQLVFDNGTGGVTVTPSTYANFTNATHLPVGTVNADMQAVYDRYYKIAKPIFDKKVGIFGESIANSSQMGLWAGQLGYDFIKRNTGDADYVLLQNAGGWRSVDYGRTPEERVDYWFLNTLMPFDNEIYLFQLKGEYLVNFLNGTRVTGSGSLTSAPVITNAHKVAGDWYVTSTGEKIDPNKLYKVSMNDFMFTGGDNYGVVEGANASPTLDKDYAVYDYDTLIMGMPLREAMADELRYRYGNLEMINVTGPDALLSTDTSAKYIFSAQNLSAGVNAITLKFRLEDAVFTGNAQYALGDWQVLTDSGWVADGDKAWTREVTLFNKIGGKDSLVSGSFDFYEAVFNYKGANEAGFTLVEIVSAKAASPGALSKFYIGDPAKTELINRSRYDVNRDGVVDLADVAAAAYFYMAKSADSDWNIEKEFDLVKVAPSYADVNGDSKVDIEDLIAILANFTVA
jgi:2',3'-cyclic-nucleotide 2'-phosphodiesterase (5'-nucleotidase family)